MHGLPKKTSLGSERKVAGLCQHPLLVLILALAAEPSARGGFYLPFGEEREPGEHLAAASSVAGVPNQLKAQGSSGWGRGWPHTLDDPNPEAKAKGGKGPGGSSLAWVAAAAPQHGRVPGAGRLQAGRAPGRAPGVVVGGSGAAPAPPSPERRLRPEAKAKATDGAARTTSRLPLCLETDDAPGPAAPRLAARADTIKVCRGEGQSVAVESRWSPCRCCCERGSWC